MAGKRFLRRIQGGGEELQRFQDSVINTFQPLLNSEIVFGVILKGELLGTTATRVEHKLGREPIGWLIITKDKASDIYSTARDSRTLSLTASVADTTVDIWVF